MAVQAAQVYSENNIGLGLGFGFVSNPLLGGGGGGGSCQDLIMDNACCGFNGVNQFHFNMQHQQQKHQEYQQLQQHMQMQRNVNFESISFSQSIALQAEKQRQEIDHYIRLQSERLRLVLQEQRKQQLEMLLKKIEIKSSALLRQKDEEIAKAANRAMELENLLKKLELESQAWQRLAQENEAMVFSLNNSLEQLKEKVSFCFFNNGAEDAESCCDIEEQEEGAEQNRAKAIEKNRVIGFGFGESSNNNNKEEGKTEQEQRNRNIAMVCKACNYRDSCVLFLPCRHLCSCKACGVFLDSCPVCLTPKKAIIEALIF